MSSKTTPFYACPDDDGGDDDDDDVDDDDYDADDGKVLQEVWLAGSLLLTSSLVLVIQR